MRTCPAASNSPALVERGWDAVVREAVPTQRICGCRERGGSLIIPRCPLTPEKDAMLTKLLPEELLGGQGLARG